MSSFLCLCAVYIAQTSIESFARPLIRATLPDREESIIQFYTYSSKRLGKLSSVALIGRRQRIQLTYLLLSPRK